MKNILEAIGVSLSRAVEHVVDKNRKTAQINRLKLVIRNEERVSEKAYVALGKYYYHHLRDASDPITEPHCAAIDQASRRMDRAITRLEELCAQPECNEEDCASCSYRCTDCGEDAFEEDEDFSDEVTESPEEAAPAEETAPVQETPAPAEEEAVPSEEAAPSEEAVSDEEEDVVYEEAEPELPVQPPVDCASREVADSRDNRDIPFI